MRIDDLKEGEGRDYFWGCIRNLMVIDINRKVYNSILFNTEMNMNIWNRIRARVYTRVVNEFSESVASSVRFVIMGLIV